MAALRRAQGVICSLNHLAVASASAATDDSSLGSFNLESNTEHDADIDEEYRCDTLGNLGLSSPGGSPIKLAYSRVHQLVYS